MKSKIVSRDELAEILSGPRANGKTVVSCNGAFDLLHAGHVRFLKEAKDQGDILVVGLNSDSSIKRYKDERRPIIPEKERAEILSALVYVDYVTLFDEEDPRALLEVLKPDVHVNGAEYGEECIEAEVVKRHGGRIHLVSRSGASSTTDIVKRILELYR